ncbi:hypothetical protein JTE90_027111 [Oedothorax gibbosus]|uniref:Transposase n=1 Tax=Oedothorax gibbosus TaxID=931172 RepID=A0AAV6TTN0_9ARAC|nr:hypothetical protein JTE90_027111 [Oedothorax gibbosus]
MEDSPRNPKLQQFYDYFVEQWLENTSVPIKMWNCYQKSHRTNNAVEGWHYKLNKLVSKSHPKLKNLIKVLKGEAQFSCLIKNRLTLHMATKSRKPKYIKQDRRIRGIIDGFYVSPNRTSASLKKTLKALAHASKLE